MSLSVLALIAAPCVTWSKTVPFQITWPPPSFHTCWIRQPTMLRRGCDRTLVVGPKLLLCFLQGDTEEVALRFDFLLGPFFPISLMFFIAILFIFANVWRRRETRRRANQLTYGDSFSSSYLQKHLHALRETRQKEITTSSVKRWRLTSCFDVIATSWRNPTQTRHLKRHRLKCSLQVHIVKRVLFGPAHSIILLMDKLLPDKDATAWN